ncbi:MAG: aminopeptidase N [Bdellovibrionota bacterium]
MRVQKILSVLIVGLSVNAWALPSNKSLLTKEEAQNRFAQVSDVKYGLAFTLPEKGPDYQGRVTISMKILKADQPLRIDFTGGQVKSLKVNGETAVFTYNDQFILINSGILKAGNNSAAIEFTHPYSTDGDGLYRFEDPVDKKIYIYSNLEPFDANRVFPCFDQPDIKATYTMDVTAPKSWEVVTSVLETGKKASGEMLVWNFPESAVMSTYIWSLHAGPYHVWKDNAGKIPLRLMARESLAKYVVAKDWFTFTKQGLRFFPRYFNTNYPYKKYDQVIVPDFNAGAMENVAAVTFSERFISRGVYSHRQRVSIASVLLHEMAHMWFGDLVTMKWWNDLWLNESFATYMSSLAMSEATEFKKDAWRDFAQGKVGSYRADQWVTTHPIEAPVQSTDDAFANFDAITYGKGASLQKQLVLYLGERKFQKGIQNYFKKHAGGNTTLTDFMRALSQASGKDLTAWSEMWLRTAGLNTLTADLVCGDDGKIQSLKLLQTAPDAHSHLREQVTKVAFLKSGKSGIKVQKVTNVLFKGASTDVNVKGQACPDIVFPNYEDHAYIKVQLDPISLKSVKAGIQNVEDPLTRQMLWVTLWDMVRDAKWSVKEYAELVLEQMPLEKDDKIIRFVSNNAASNSDLSNVFSYLPRETENDKKYLADWIGRFETLARTELEKSPAGSERQKIWFNVFVNTGETPQAREKMQALLDGNAKLPEFTVDQDKRWALIQTLCVQWDPTAKSRMEKEAVTDTSAQGQLEVLTCQAALADASNKKAIMEKLKVSDNFSSLKKADATVRGLYPNRQEPLIEPLSKNFYDTLAAALKKESPTYLKTLTNAAPRECGTSAKFGSAEFLASQKTLPATVQKALKIINQEGQTCRQIRALAKDQSLTAPN